MISYAVDLTRLRRMLIARSVPDSREYPMPLFGRCPLSRRSAVCAAHGQRTCRWSVGEAHCFRTLSRRRLLQSRTMSKRCWDAGTFADMHQKKHPKCSSAHETAINVYDCNMSNADGSDLPNFANQDEGTTVTFILQTFDVSQSKTPADGQPLPPPSRYTRKCK